MAELRIPREEERIELEKDYECLKKECKWVEGLISITYKGFHEERIPRVRCAKSNLFLNPKSKVCGSYTK